ncbi:hypothetical protein AWB69_05332 [Caballeronia udeis]|uniref:Uncharacterized protein n=1 Tax=Caballeronia udeis TaxID=1232866 RepID=A0A158I5J5_9BURK|nr:hypothetical protein AWB69_05332 [Caballeronia udeis]
MIDEAHFIWLYYFEIVVVGIVLNEVVDVVEPQFRDSIKMMVWKINTGDRHAGVVHLLVPLYQRSRELVSAKQRRMNLSMVFTNSSRVIEVFLGRNTVSLIKARLQSSLIRWTVSHRKQILFAGAY